MNESYYFSSIYNKSEVERIHEIGRNWGWIPECFVAYTILMIIFKTPIQLWNTRKALVIHEVTLLFFEVYMFQIIAPTVYFPIVMGDGNGALKGKEYSANAFLLIFVVPMWHFTCSTILQVLLYKHQNLWPPGWTNYIDSRWKIKGKGYLCAFFHLITTVPQTVVMNWNAWNKNPNKQLVAERYPFAEPLIREEPRVIVLDDVDNTLFNAFIALELANVVLFVVLAIGLTVSTFWVLRTQKPGLSNETYKLQIHHFIKLLVQLFVPCCFTVPPISVLVFSLVTKTWLPVVVYVICLKLIGLQGFVSSCILISVNTAYRKHTLKIMSWPFLKVYSLVCPKKYLACVKKNAASRRVTKVKSYSVP